MDNDSTNQPQANDPYAPQNLPPQPVPAADAPAGYQPPAPAPQPLPQASQRPALRIDHNLLADLGLAALPEEEKKALEKHIYETLEMRVGMRLADQMTNEQLDEFETYFNARDDAGAFRWLETNFPNYKDIVADEFDKLKSEVAVQGPAILAASGQQAAGQMAPEAQQPSVPPQSEAVAPQSPPQQLQPQPSQPFPQQTQPQQPQQQSQQWPTPPMPPQPPTDQQQPPQQPTA